MISFKKDVKMHSTHSIGTKNYTQHENIMHGLMIAVALLAIVIPLFASS